MLTKSRPRGRDHYAAVFGPSQVNHLLMNKQIGCVCDRLFMKYFFSALNLVLCMEFWGRNWRQTAVESDTPPQETATC